MSCKKTPHQLSHSAKSGYYIIILGVYYLNHLFTASITPERILDIPEGGVSDTHTSVVYTIWYRSGYY